MGRKKVEPKTDLGRRLSAVRVAIGVDDRDTLAARLGIGSAALGYYERGERLPDAEVMKSYIEQLGININWLLTGNGQMFEEPSKLIYNQAHFQRDLMERMARVVDTVYTKLNIVIQPTRLAGEAAILLNELLTYGINLTDADEVEASIPRLTLSLTRRLQNAVEDPKSGKYVA